MPKSDICERAELLDYLLQARKYKKSEELIEQVISALRSKGWSTKQLFACMDELLWLYPVSAQGIDYRKRTEFIRKRKSNRVRNTGIENYYTPEDIERGRKFITKKLNASQKLSVITPPITPEVLKRMILYHLSIPRTRGKKALKNFVKALLSRDCSAKIMLENITYFNAFVPDAGSAKDVRKLIHQLLRYCGNKKRYKDPDYFEKLVEIHKQDGWTVEWLCESHNVSFFAYIAKEDDMTDINDNEGRENVRKRIRTAFAKSGAL